MILPDFTGPIGGMLAAMFMTGVLSGWGLCVRIRVEPLRQQLSEAQIELRDFLAAAKAKLLGGP